MDYQSDGTQVNTRPAPKAISGTPGWVTSGNVSAGLAPSDDDPDVMNAILDEIINVIKSVGLTPSKTNNAQLLAAIQSIATGSAPEAQAPNPTGFTQIAAFVASANIQTWSAPYTGAVKIRCWSGGGSGGSGNGAAGGGGTAGGYVEGYLNLSQGQTLNMQVGFGGAAPGQAAAGNAGGSTIVGSGGNNYVNITGGVGGAKGIVGSNAVGSGGGTPSYTANYFSGAVFYQNGNVGGLGNALISGALFGGAGGSTFGGNGGVAVSGSTSSNFNGNPGFGSGSAGGGGTGSGSGAAGVGGLIVIEFGT